MKTISVLAFVAPTVAAQKTFRYGTWCGRADGMVVTEDSCKAAAKAGGLPYASAAGPEWHAGCIINNNAVYFSNPDVKGKHDQAVNGGYFCEKQMNIKRKQKGEKCAWSDMISNEQMCARAAQENGIKYASKAGADWNMGCIVNGGAAYYTELRKQGPEGKATDGGQLCINNDVQRKEEDAYFQVVFDKSREATMSKLRSLPDEGLDEVRMIVSKFENHLQKHEEKVRDEVKKMREATSFEAYSRAEKFVNDVLDHGLGVTATHPSTEDVREKIDHIVTEHRMELTRKREMEWAKEAERKQKEAEEAERKLLEAERERKQKEYEQAKKEAEEAERKQKEAEMANMKCNEECVVEWKNQRWTTDDAERASIMCRKDYHAGCATCDFCDIPWGMVYDGQKPHIPWHERKQCQPENCKQWSCNDHNREVGSWCACWQEGVDYPLCPATDDDVCDCSGKMSGAKERGLPISTIAAAQEMSEEAYKIKPLQILNHDDAHDTVVARVKAAATPAIKKVVSHEKVQSTVSTVKHVAGKAAEATQNAKEAAQKVAQQASQRAQEAASNAAKKAAEAAKKAAEVLKSVHVPTVQVGVHVPTVQVVSHLHSRFG